MKILIDNGHGVETPGKCSPDGRRQKRSYTRLIARENVSHLTAAGVTAQLVVPEDMDVPLPERSRMELLHYPRGYPGRCAGYCAL